MKTMVVFHLPEGKLLWCDLSDLALTPGLRSTYQFEGKEYDVERPREILTRNPDGSRKPTSEKLLDLMIAVAGDTPMAALALISGMRNVGEPNLDHSSGGIIFPGPSNRIEEADHLVVLTMRHIGDVPKVDRDTMLKAMKSFGI